MLVAESLFSLIFALAIIICLTLIVKYREPILAWMSKKGRATASDAEMDYYDRLIDSGVDEEEAIRLVRYSRTHRRAIKERIAKDNDETETQG